MEVDAASLPIIVPTNLDGWRRPAEHVCLSAWIDGIATRRYKCRHEDFVNGVHITHVCGNDGISGGGLVPSNLVRTWVGKA